jgi:hypothetical protein
MFNIAKRLILSSILTLAPSTFAAHVILNEYNAVSPDTFLGGGTAFADEDGGRASDSYFGRVIGNGGDWFELVVITDHLDMRRWVFDIYEDGLLDESLELTSHSIWADIRSGTIITISEDLPSDISYDPAAGDWWINVQANDSADGLYIEASSFPVGSSNWQLRIRNASNTVIFGPAGEGISPKTGIGGNEVFKLETVPTAATIAASLDYDGGKELSTFGSPNQWGIQDLSSLRNVVALTSTLTLLTPNGGQTIPGGADYEITWNSTGTVGGVQIAFTTDNGLTWSEVYPPNIGNSGSYLWLVPFVESQQCRIKITNLANPTVYDISNAAFTIYECGLQGDLTGDCAIDLNDLVTLAASWLQCNNPNSALCPE